MPDRSVPAREPISRRRFGALTLLAGPALAACGAPETAAPAPAAAPTGPQKVPYGSDPSQFGEFTVPAGAGAVRGIVVVVHGGSWGARYGLELGRPIAAELVRSGWATWNFEYRRLGNGGGWTSTFDDVALALDHVRSFASARIANRVFAVGHSAGGHLAAWLACRPGLPPRSPGTAPDGGPPVRLSGLVSQAGVLDLAMAARRSGSAVVDLVGGAPATVPDRYRIASPAERLPMRVPIVCVHGDRDDIVPIAQSETYVQKARAAGDPAEFVRVPGAGHMDLIDVRTAAWKACAAGLERIAAG